MDKITLVSKGASLSISDEKLLIKFDRDMNFFPPPSGQADTEAYGLLLIRS